MLVLAACGSGGTAAPESTPHPVVAQVPTDSTAATLSSVPPVLTAPSPSAAQPEDCPLPQSGFDCDFQRRIAAAESYAGGRPGTVGIVLRDRQTGAVWRNAHAGDLTWTASTIKLAMVVDLLRRSRTHAITLSAGDRAQMAAMLHNSDDDAATTLWTKYGGKDHTAFNEAFPAYGMTSLRAERGYSKVFPYWGFQKCTADDLDRLINHVLGIAPAEDRAFILDHMRQVAPNQQWGVWGAGAAAHPGNKDGWSDEDGGWVMNTVGFVGPGERYTLAIMNNLRGKGGYDEGRQTDTEIARLLFAGRF
ncbi:serine hydrolase [Actinokineospora diospyrosa]